MFATIVVMVSWKKVKYVMLAGQMDVLLACLWHQVGDAMVQHVQQDQALPVGHLGKQLLD